MDVEVPDELGGATGVLLECLLTCNNDVRASVLGNLVICGGGSMIPGKMGSIER
jgi:actin-related protein